MWWRVGIGLFLLGHAFVHAVWRTYGPKASWLMPGMAEASQRSLSTAIFVLAAIGFGLAGVFVLLNQPSWRFLAIVSCLISLLLFGLFWSRGLIVGTAIDIAILIALVWLHWPPASMVGS